MDEAVGTMDWSVGIPKRFVGIANHVVGTVQFSGGGRVPLSVRAGMDTEGRSQCQNRRKASRTG